MDSIQSKWHQFCVNILRVIKILIYGGEKMQVRNLARKTDLPLTHLTRSQKIRSQVLIDYYESKIDCLLNLNLPPKLIFLACWDAPVEREDLSTKRGWNRFLKKCLKHYRNQVKNINKWRKKINTIRLYGSSLTITSII